MNDEIEIIRKCRKCWHGCSAVHFAPAVGRPGEWECADDEWGCHKRAIALAKAQVSKPQYILTKARLSRIPPDVTVGELLWLWTEATGG